MRSVLLSAVEEFYEHDGFITLKQEELEIPRNSFGFSKIF